RSQRRNVTPPAGAERPRQTTSVASPRRRASSAPPTKPVAPVNATRLGKDSGGNAPPPLRQLVHVALDSRDVGQDGQEVQAPHPGEARWQRVQTPRDVDGLAEGELHEEVRQVQARAREEEVRREEAADVDLRRVRDAVAVVGEVDGEDAVRPLVDGADGAE